MEKMPKIVIGLIILFLYFKIGILTNILSGVEISPGVKLFSETEMKLMSVPWIVRILIGLIGLWFILGKFIGYFTILLGILATVALFPVGMGILGIIIIIIGIIEVKAAN